MSDRPESDAFRLAHSTSHLLHRAQQLAADRFAFLSGAKGVTLRQFALLQAISENNGLSQTDLVRATGIDRSTLAEMINRMEKRGLVSRASSSDDARANAVSLAQNGDALLRAMMRNAKAADAAILDALPRNKRRAFQATLEKLAEIADREKERIKARAEEEAHIKAEKPAKDSEPTKPKRRRTAKPAPKPKRRRDYINGRRKP